MIIQKFETQVTQTPDHIAIAPALTYQQLNNRANRLAHTILSRLSSPATSTQQAALLIEKGADMIVSMLAALKAQMAYVPLDISYPRERLSYMITHSQSRILISNHQNRELATTLVQEHGGQLTLILIEDIAADVVETNPPRHPADDRRAYILYTSGSTGLPKGVVQIHQHVLYYVSNWIRVFSITSQDKLTFLTAFTHDGAMQDIFAALLAGATLCPFDIKTMVDRQELADYIQDQHITLWHSVPTLYRYFIDTLEGIVHYPHLRAIILGGEPLREHDVSRFKQHFPSALLANVYGQTESSVSTICLISPHTPFKKVTLGQPLDETQILLVDDNDEVVEGLGSGEIVVLSPYLAPEYWQDPEETKKKFTRDPELGPMYWTGDLGAYLGGGDIEILGRKDFQVKIRGFRVEMGEIESKLLGHPFIQEAVVTAREDEIGEKYLCAYFVPADIAAVIPSNNELRDYLSQHVPDYMVPARFIPLPQMPLTGTGKIDRKALPEPETLEPERIFIAPANDTEQKLARIWAEVLSRQEGTREPIGRDDNFFRLGGHSLRAMTVISKVHKEFNVKLEIEEIFTYALLKDLGARIDGATTHRYHAIDIAEKREYYPLSSAQKRLYLLHQMEPQNTGYNLTVVVELTGVLDLERLQESFRVLIGRHDSLRTSFLMENEEPVQHIHDLVPFVLETIPWEKDHLVHHFIRAFDLAQPPLLRVGVVYLAEQRHLVMLDMHHIICDGTSGSILINEFFLLYSGHTLPSLFLQYRDYAVWQNSPQQQQVITNQKEYWLQVFASEPPALQLPIDFPRPTLQSYEGDTVGFHLEAGPTAALKVLAASRNITLYMVLLAAYNVLLWRLSGQEDIVVGVPTAGRRHVDLESVVGMFINTLALRNFPSGPLPFDRFLAEVSAHTLQAFENQDYPFEDLVSQVAPVRDTSRHPLFNTMLVLQNFAPQDRQLPPSFLAELTVQRVAYESKTTLFELDVMVVESQEALMFQVEYGTTLFKRETMERFCRYFKCILQYIGDRPDISLAAIDVLEPAEKEQLLYTFNQTAGESPAEQTIHDAFAQQVARTPDAMAVVGTDPQTMVSLTYGALNARVDQLAALLKSHGVGVDTIVAIKMPATPEMVIALLSILKAGGAYLPIDMDCPPDRTQYMLQDSRALIIVTENGVDDVRALEETRATTGGCPYGCPNAGDGMNLAYLLYTSGSTGIPKGVMVEHGSVLNTLLWFGKTHGLGPDKHVLQMSHYTFDPSVEDIFGSLLCGAVLYPGGRELMSQPDLFRQFLAARQIHLIGFVPAGLQELLVGEGVPRVTSLEQVISGGERLSEFLKDQLLARGYTLYNHYGPTEAAIDVLSNRCSGEPVTLGTPITGMTCFILGQEGELVPRGVMGELCVAGPGLARGYLNDPRLTQQKFIETLWFDAPDTPFRYYHTGDLARYWADGRIEFLGRVDQQVKIRGFRIEPGEIENTLTRHPGVQEAVVMARSQQMGERQENYLCAYVVPVVAGDTLPEELKDYLAQSLPTYMVPAFILLLPHIPRTENGKVHYRLLPEPQVEQDGSASFVPPQTPLEMHLASLWAGVLGVEPHQLGRHANFFQWGGHSLKATVLLARIHKEMGVRVPLTQMFLFPTIETMARCIEGLEKETFTAIPRAPEQAYYRLSSAQERLYILQQMDKQAAGYNMPMVLELLGQVDEEKLTATFKHLIRRHESLRTSFEMQEGEPQQWIHPDVPFAIETPTLAEDYSQADITALINGFFRPFDLSHAPLLRVGLMGLEPTRHIFLVDMHHIMCDGTSAGILIKEFMDIYGDRPLSPLKRRYRDYSHWQHSPAQKELLTQQESFWLTQFADPVVPLELPYDFPRPVVQSFAGHRIGVVLGAELATAMRELATGQDVTLFMVLLAIFNVLLAKLTGNEEIVIGTPIAGRRHADLEPLIGMFVNTLALKNQPDPTLPFHTFLTQLKKNTLAAYENQEYQFEDLVQSLALPRDASRNPLFDVLFVLQNLEDPRFENPGLQVQPYPYINRTAKFDLNLEAVERGDQLQLTLEYCTHLFKEATAQRFLRYFQKIARTVVENPSIPITDILLPDEEELAILQQMSSGVTEPIPGGLTIQALFEERVALGGAETALLFDGECLTYTQLNQRANSLAHRLRAKGVGTDSPVGVMAESSFEMVIGMLAIIKAGGAYLPIDPEYPAQRKAFMMADSGITLLLTRLSEPLEPAILPAGVEVLDLTAPVWYQGNTQNPAAVTDGSSLLYVIYTSGSTGVPKGVLLEHRNLVNLLLFQYRHTRIDFSRVLQFTTISFDVSFQEIFSTLCAGGQLLLIDRETKNNVPRLCAAITQHQIKTLFWPASFLKFVFSDPTYAAAMPVVSHMVTAGEQLLVTPLLSHYLQAHGVLLHNHYGPSETHVATTLTLDPSLGQLPALPSIGTPIANTRIRILEKNRDSHLEWHLQPLGVAGELAIAGIAVGRGYLNRAELTQQKFQGQLYKTGDLARWLADGSIQFLGRIDQQVKIRGFRVEPGEIERYLVNAEGVKEALVVPITREDGSGLSLCAYIVAVSSAEVFIQSLREYLSQGLPAYMVPSYFVCLDQIPLTPNRKVDKKALPRPDFMSHPVPLHPQKHNYIEARLVELWSTIITGKEERLQTQAVAFDLDANLFLLGGSSLDIIKLASRLYTEYQIEIPVMQLLKNPTLREISRFILDRTFERTEEEAFTLMNPGRSRFLFCFPPGVGYGFVYRQLAELLTGYTLCAFNYIESQDRLERYWELIQQFQPSGPYLLFAFSAGGELALAVAHFLEQAGHRVSDIILLDCYRSRGKLQAGRLEAFKQTVAQSLESMGVQYLKDKVMRKVTRYSDYFDNLTGLQPVDAVLHLITAPDRVERETRDQSNEAGPAGPTWEQLTRAGVQTYEGQGIHVAMLENENLPPNAALIRQILETARLTQELAVVKPNHRRLSLGAAQFIEYVEKTAAVVEESQFRTLDRAKFGPYSLNAWPTLVSHGFGQEIAAAALQVFALFKSLPRLFFHGHVEEMSKYFELSPRMIETQLKCSAPRNLNALIARGDFVWTEAGFKCLEYNIATNVGGVQLEMWDRLYQETPVLAQFLQEYGVQIDNPNLVSILFQHLLTAAGEMPAPGFLLDNVNIAIVTADYREFPVDMINYLNTRYRQELHQKYPGCTGTLSYCDYSHLEVSDGQLYYNHQRIKILVELYQGVVPPHILDIAEAGNLCLLNGPIVGLLSNKLSMALLSEHVDSGRFSVQEQAWINQYIPWTRKVVPGPTMIPSGATVEMAEYLYTHREGLVLKPAGGYGGFGVSIGKFLSPEVWQERVSVALKERKWLVQEYWAPLPLLYQTGQSGCGIHDSVWGFFVFGNHYGGGFLRVMPRENYSGVINAQQGAVISGILEVAE